MVLFPQLDSDARNGGASWVLHSRAVISAVIEIPENRRKLNRSYAQSPHHQVFLETLNYIHIVTES